jgi:hypothetical protein
MNHADEAVTGLAPAAAEVAPSLFRRALAALGAVLGSDCSVSTVAGGVYGFVGTDPTVLSR